MIGDNLNYSKDLDNLVPDIYKMIEVLSDGKQLDISDDMIHDFGERMKAARSEERRVGKEKRGGWL